MVIGFVVWSIVAACFAGIGMNCWKSKETVGFFTFVKPPMIASENIIKYNHAVSMLWLIVSFLLEMIGVPLLFIEQNSPIAIVMAFAVMLLVVIMMVAYIRIEAKYKA